MGMEKIEKLAAESWKPIAFPDELVEKTRHYD